MTIDSAMACEEALVRAAALLLARHATAAEPSPVPGNVEQARDRLADDLLRTPTLAELAALSGLSRYQLLRRFEASYGLPPHAWLRQRRAERARGLILRGTSLAHASASSGFADQSHMTRVFVRLYGYTPGLLQGSRSSRTHDAAAPQ